MPGGTAGTRPTTVNGEPQILWFLRHGPQSGIVDVRQQGAAHESPVEGSELPTREQVFFDAATRFDLIALGRPGVSRSYILPNGGFLYSIMQFQVEDVVKNNPTAPVQPGALITIGREGGILRVKSKSGSELMLRNWSLDDPLFQTGRQYLLFFEYIPKAQIYLASRYGYKFAEGKTVATDPAGEAHEYLSGPTIVGMDKDELLQMAKGQAQRAREGGGKQ
ncbi:MAG TPA: hypothetical protein VGV68_03735 [Terriglobia bacterium]|nr:hypothetical protein [Terriglobia bacterium]